MSHSDAGVLNVNFRTPATHKMAPWVRKTFIDFLPKFLFIERPPPAPPLEDQPNAELNAGFNIVFPETLEERHSVSRLLNHAQYDGGGFRLIYCTEGECRGVYSISWISYVLRERKWNRIMEKRIKVVVRRIFIINSSDIEQLDLPLH